MSRLLIVIAWMAGGVYFAIAALGGMAIAPFAALGCGWFAGRTTRQQGGRSDDR